MDLFFNNFIKLFYKCSKFSQSNESLHPKCISVMMINLLIFHKNQITKEPIEQAFSLFKEHDIIENDTYKIELLVEATRQRFQEIPKEIREQIWNGFLNTLFVVSIEILDYKKSIEIVILSLLTYIVLFFTLGIWNPQKNDIEHWKKITYILGRNNRVQNSTILKIQFVEHFPHLTYALYLALQDDN